MDDNRENEDDHAIPIANPIQNPPNNQNPPPNQVRIQQLPPADFASYQRLPVDQYGRIIIDFFY